MTRIKKQKTCSATMEELSDLQIHRCPLEQPHNSSSRGDSAANATTTDSYSVPAPARRHRGSRRPSRFSPRSGSALSSHVKSSVVVCVSLCVLFSFVDACKAVRFDENTNNIYPTKSAPSERPPVVPPPAAVAARMADSHKSKHHATSSASGSSHKKAAKVFYQTGVSSLSI